MKVILTSTMEYRFKAPKSDGTAGVWAERKCTLSQGEDASLHLYLDGGTQKTQQSFEITPANWKVQEGEEGVQDGEENGGKRGPKGKGRSGKG